MEIVDEGTDSLSLLLDDIDADCKNGLFNDVGLRRCNLGGVVTDDIWLPRLKDMMFDERFYPITILPIVNQIVHSLETFEYKGKT